METRVLLISEQYMRDHTDFSESINSKSMITAIEEAQSFYLASVVGDRYYEHLCEKVKNNSWVANDKDKYLLDKYIQPYLYAQASAVLVEKIQFRVGNAGVTKDSASTDTKKLVDYYNNLTGISLKRMTDYLCKHLQDYQPYFNNVEGIKPHLSASDQTSIFLGNSPRYKYPVDEGWRR